MKAIGYWKCFILLKTKLVLIWPKNIVNELEIVFLLPPNDTGHIRAVVTSPSQIATMIKRQKNEVLYRTDSINNPIDILDMTASIQEYN